MRALRFLAIAGDILFIFWITYNGIDEGFAGTLPEKVSSICLVALLLVNAWFLWRRTD